MDQEVFESLKHEIETKKPKYHLIVICPIGSSSRYRGEHHDIDYVITIADEILGSDICLYNFQRMFRETAHSLRIHPSGLVIPQGHGDINAISNLEKHFGGKLPDIHVFHAMKNTGHYCREDGSLINPYVKHDKDLLVQDAYRRWLLNSIKPNPLSFD